MDSDSPAEASEGEQEGGGNGRRNSGFLNQGVNEATEAASGQPGRRNSLAEGNGRRNSSGNATPRDRDAGTSSRDVSEQTSSWRNSGNETPTEQTSSRRNSASGTPRDFSEQTSSRRNSGNGTSRDVSDLNSSRRYSGTGTSRDVSEQDSSSRNATPRGISEQDSSSRNSESATPREQSERRSSGVPDVPGRRNSGAPTPRDVPEQRNSGLATPRDALERRTSFPSGQQNTSSVSEGENNAATPRSGENGGGGEQGTPLSARNGRRSSISQLLDRVNGRRPSIDAQNVSTPRDASPPESDIMEDSKSASSVAPPSLVAPPSPVAAPPSSPSPVAAPPTAEPTSQRRPSQNVADDLSHASTVITDLINRVSVSGEQADDLSHASALITELINRVSVSSEGNVDRSAGDPERRESLRRASIMLGKTSLSHVNTAGPVNPPERRLSNTEAESPGKPAGKQWGGTRESSDADSTDGTETEYMMDVVRKRRSMREEDQSRRDREQKEAVQQLNAAGVNAPDFHTRLLALRMAVQDYELPMRLAYDELDDLAENANRVKRAIEKNMNLLTVQIKRSCMRYIRSAFRAWLFYCSRKRGRRLAAKNATEYFHRRVLWRAFQACRIFYLRRQKFRRMQQSAEKFMRRHNLARIWGQWTALVKKRIREDERHRREKQLVREVSSKQREATGRRGVNALRRLRLQRAYSAFKMGVAISKEIDSGRDHIFYILLRRKAALVLKFWKKYPTRRAREKRAVLRRKTKILRSCFWCWDDQTGYGRYRNRRMGRRRLRNAFGLWVLFVCQKARYDTIVMRVTRKRLRRCFNDLREGCLEEKWRKRNIKRIQKRCEDIRLRCSFKAWIWYMQIQAHKRTLRVEEYVAVLEKENLRTRTECDRLARIIETGEWDSLELEHASHILSGERDALTKLVGRLEREHAQALQYKNEQEEEIRMLKEQMLGGNFVHRNKLLVRGASSFNSVVRAVKSEVLKRGVNPEVVYSIDNMAMEKVSVFPEGDLKVKPIGKFDKEKWMHRASTDTTRAFMEPPKLLISDR